MVAHVCDPNTWVVEEGWLPWVQGYPGHTASKIKQTKNLPFWGKGYLEYIRAVGRFSEMVLNYYFFISWNEFFQDGWPSSPFQDVWSSSPQGTRLEILLTTVPLPSRLTCLLKLVKYLYLVMQLPSFKIFCIIIRGSPNTGQTTKSPLISMTGSYQNTWVWPALLKLGLKAVLRESIMFSAEKNISEMWRLKWRL